MYKDIEKLYTRGKSAEKLASEVLEMYFGTQEPSVPINPFKIMQDMGIVYQFIDSKDLEGIYIVPEDDNDIPVIGINRNRPITRQRYTAAHELCHHIKDKNTECCSIKCISSSATERYAECFAAALLMPEKMLLEYSRQYMVDGYVTMDDALHISEHFGVSFSACVRRLAYKLHILRYEDNTQLTKAIKKYKPDYKKSLLNIDRENIELLKQVVDSYSFVFNKQNELLWYVFKNAFVYNENRLEGVNLDQEEVAEIITDLRMNRQNSEYCKSEYEDIIQVVGHSEIYEFVSSTKDKISAFSLLNLNKMLFQYAPYPEEGGKTRQDNALVLGASFETYDFKDIPVAISKLDLYVKDVIERMDQMTVSDYITCVAKIHHKITQIHPFSDGNGRCSRAFLNWMLRLKNLPPIYIKSERKDAYYEALKLADSQKEYKEIIRIIIHELFNTIMYLNRRH